MLDLVQALDATGLPFDEVPSPDPSAQSTSFKVRRKQLRVDVLVPLVGRPTNELVLVRGLNVHATPLRHLDYLIESPVDAALACRRGILVRIPDPARFAFHKLIVAESRPLSEQVKRTKDLAQSEQLLEVLAQDRPSILEPAWRALCDRGERWKQKALSAFARLSDDVRAAVPLR